MTLPSQETLNALQKQDIINLKEHVKNLEEDLSEVPSKTDFDDLKAVVSNLAKDRDNALRWGIIMLGTAVVSMGLWIFNLIAKNIK